MTAPTRYDVTREELATVLEGQPRYRTDQVWKGLYEENRTPEEMSNLPKALRSTLAEKLPPALIEETRSSTKSGDTTKYLWRLADGQKVETVLMVYPERATVCVSTQAGCAMGCTFCATGQAGYSRNLTVGEIVEQVMVSAREAAPRRVSNVVFMGMGEPMANYDATWEAVLRLQGDVGISARHLTISTVGLIPGIERLSRASLPVNLAVSLHAANNRLRDELVPINRRYPLDALVAACVVYFAATSRRVTFEWALIDGVNDRTQDAHELASIARTVRAHVNLIPLNPTPGFLTQGTRHERVVYFRDQLTALGVNATIRANRGTDIEAACGQLRASHIEVPPAAQNVTITRD